MATASHHRFTFGEYVQLVEDRSMKLEFLGGQVWAMSGGTPEHARITANISRLLGNAVVDRPCGVYSPDLRVRSAATGLATYADVTIVCGALELDPEDPKKHTALNPRLLVEVLSPSTEDYDRGEKLEHYKTIPALEEIVLVAWDRREVEVLRRTPTGWVRRLTSEGAVELCSLDCELSLALADIYRDPFASDR